MVMLLLPLLLLLLQLSVMYSPTAAAGAANICCMLMQPIPSDACAAADAFAAVAWTSALLP